MATTAFIINDSFLYDFDAQVIEALEHQGKTAIVLDRTAFYPTSGGQVYDLGTLAADENRLPSPKLPTMKMDAFFHFASEPLAIGTQVHGSVDAARRRDHVQQTHGQHVLSAASSGSSICHVSFHMGEESCTIDLETSGFPQRRRQKAELWPNEVIAKIGRSAFALCAGEARQLGLRKLPPNRRATCG